MHAKKHDVRLELKAIYAHYQGAGNLAQRIWEATWLHETLYYKSKRSLSFATLLSKIQHMLNLFEEEEEPLPEGAMFRLLLDKVNHHELQTVIKALRVCDSLESRQATTFTEAANVLAASVASLP